MANLTKNFTVAEMACPHCGLCLMQDDFMARLQGLRDALGAPITVTSGYRCPTHNKSIGGAKESFHTRGMAADLRAEDMEELEMKALMFFPVVIKGPNFIHCDTGPKRHWRYV